MLPSELKLVSLNHCYIHLPETFVSKQPALKAGSIVSIKSVQNETELFVTWNGQLSPEEFAAQIDLSFAQANGFQDELIVISLAISLRPSECSMCRVELIDATDYSIVSQHLEANVLDTCKLVSRDLVMPIWLSKHVKILVKVVAMQPDEDFGILTKWTEMQFHDSLDRIPKAENPPEEEDSPITNPVPFVSYCLGLFRGPEFYPGSIVVCGERGSGKTHLLKRILSSYKKFNSELVNCKQFLGKRPENVKKKLVELLQEALEKQPFILALDDIDSFVSHQSKHEEEKGQEVIYKLRLVDAVCNLFEQLEHSDHIKGRHVLIIASCRSLESLDERISKPNGGQYFNEVIKLGPPSLLERVEIIKAIIAEHKQVQVSIDDSQIEIVAKRCTSFMPSDLRRLVERNIINVCSKSLLDFHSDPVTVQLEDSLSSLNDYSPMNLRGVALKEKSVKSFDDVGGMSKIKDAIMKTIMLPIEYPKLFEECPFKTQTSILLYGPPGCGKTLIAEALTNQDHINSICIRGPELLSKYIGASEAAVRDLFRRAELARPCVIFFDEFESLVAKRGADSTGVTDRIVNQFLTMMDGFEKLSNDVFIVAASSRPDMIDPAILRPGRLDRHIYCPVPDQSDRLDILKVVGRHLKIEAFDEHLEDWACKLEGFTGADIQAFLYSAQLSALHSIVGPSGSCKGCETTPRSEIEIAIKQVHLEESYEAMKLEVASRFARLEREYPALNKRPDQKQFALRATLA